MNDKSIERKKINPGSLHSDDSFILLHTRHAISLFEGRRGSANKAEIYGVARFSGSVGQIYNAAKADDPWADWWLVKIDEQIDRSRTKLNEYRSELDLLYPASKNINITTPESIKPVSKPLEFGTPSYPYRLAYLVVDYDELCSMIRGLVHHGLLPKAKGERYMNLAGRPIRSALQAASGYRYQGVTRNDVVANNPKAQKARTLMGEVPQDIFDLKLRSDFAPVLRQYEEPDDTELEVASG
ncbi:MAG: TIGR03761 family integrating conjugative element protein [Gammaproteobacteria bacterium]|nr:TIGR03761 family integrating conjugative element protein [Gammaproteobacteria bacterium]